MSVKQKYRPDIDGLRAIAVLSVILYHFNKSLVPGGFIGVDVFFVISGYLITRNIWNDMVQKKFSFGQFYLRRIRRIAPAFFAVLMLTLVAGSLLLLPDDMVSLARSGLWGTLSAANVYFWKFLDTSYFAESSDQVPLLHTWSLGVEEQFYLFWPGLLIIASFFRSKRFIALGTATLICIASFICAELTSVSAQKFAYYMLPPRAGELMMGAILAIWIQNSAVVAKDFPAREAFIEALAVAGILLLGLPLALINDDSRFPGLNAFYPCLGTAILIAAGGEGSRVVKALLSPRPLVFIGLISYSLYLWHWPILAFIRYFYGSVTGWPAVAAAVSIPVLSYCSYRFIEKPTRTSDAARMKQVFAMFILPGAVIASTALVMISTGGMRSIIESSSGYSTKLARLQQETAPAYNFYYNCQQSSFNPNILREARCIVGPAALKMKNAEPKILLWGDSEAAHYIGVLGKISKIRGFTFRNATLSSCPPVFGGEYGQGQYKEGCRKFRPYMRDAILSDKYPVVIMSGAWSHYFREPGFEADLVKTLSEIEQRGSRVLLIGEAPYFPRYDRNCELRALRIGGLDCENRQRVPDKLLATADQKLVAISKKFQNVRYVDVRDILCRDGWCSPYLDGHPVYYNPTHLSMVGSWLIGDKLVRKGDLRAWDAGIGIGAGNGTIATLSE